MSTPDRPLSMPAAPAAPAGDPAVALTGVTKRYGAQVALHDATLTVPAGAVCGLVGPNGAGKSTLMSIVATLLRPTAGRVEVFGVPTTRPAEVRALVGYVPDVLGTYTDLSVEEYLLFFADAHRVAPETRRTLVDHLLDLVELADKRDADVNTLSRGMKQRIGLARGLVHGPRLLVLDEPASGLDPRARIHLRELVAHLRSTGVTVLISSHILTELEEMCSHAIVLEQGSVVAVETLGGEPDVRSIVVRFLDGTTEHHQVASDQAQAALVRSLVESGRHVVAVTAGSDRLEDRFMRLTDGRTN